MTKYVLIVLHKLHASFGYYDVQTGILLNRMATKLYPHELCLSPDRSKLYVTEYGLRGVESPGRGGNTVAVFDVKTGNQISAISTGEYDRPHGIVSHANNTLCVTSESTQNLLVFDLVTEQLLHVVNTDQDLTHMVNIAPDGKIVFAANIASRSLTAINVETGGILKNIAVLQRPEGMAFSPEGDRIAFPLFHADAIQVAGTATREILCTIPVGKQPAGTTISPDGKLVFVACELENKVYVFSMDDYSIVNTIETENGCDAMVCLNAVELG